MEQLPLFPSAVKNTAIEYSAYDLSKPDITLHIAIDILHILFSSRFENIVMRNFFNIDSLNWHIYYDTHQHRLRFGMAIPIKDRSTGDTSTIVSSEPLTDEMINDEFVFLKTVRRLLQNAAVHEVDEAFLYKGERIFDPHAKTK